MTAAVQLELSDHLLDELAERVAARVLARMDGRAGEDGWLSTKQAASYLGRSVGGVQRLAAAGELPVHQDRPNGRLRFRKSELDRSMAA